MNDMIESLNAVSESNRRLAIMGKFSSQEDRRRLVFSSKGEAGANRLTLNDFFEVLQPEIQYKSEGTVRIGATLYNKYSLKSPADVEGLAGRRQLITSDSDLLTGVDPGIDPNATEESKRQAIGGKIFKRLLEDLDEVVKFSDGKFSSAVLTFSRYYMFKCAQVELPDHQVDVSHWQDLAYDQPLSSSILHFMTCHADDVDAAGDEVRKRLLMDDDDHKVTEDQATALVTGLRRGRRVLEEGLRNDEIYLEISKAKAYGWLNEYTSNPTFGISIANAGGKTFMDHYRYYRERSDSLHRLVRTESLHSYMFCWLAAKYQPHDSTDGFRSAAKKMFELGVVGQGDKRIPGATAEEMRRHYKLVKEAASEADGREKLTGDDIYEKAELLVERVILDELRPGRVFRRDTLMDRNRRLFVLLGQLAGGAVGEVLSEAGEVCKGYMKFYRVAKNASPEQGKSLSKDDILAAFERVKTDRDEEFFEKISAAVSDMDLEGEDLRSAAADEVVSRIAVSTKTSFDSGWLDRYDEIEAATAALGEIYDMRNALDIDRGRSNRGMPALHVTDVNVKMAVEAGLGADDEDDRFQSSLKEALSDVGIGSGGQNVNLSIPTPAALQKAIEDESVTEGQEFTVKKGDEEIWSGTFGEGGLNLAEKDDGNVEILLDQEADDLTLNIGDQSVQWKDIDLSELASSVVQAEQRDQNFGELLSQYSSMTDVMNRVREQYVKDRTGGDSDFAKIARSLTLGEYMASTPTEQTNLGKGDLSSILGVMLDMVEHLGDLSEGDKLYNPTEALTDDVLGRVNLSTHYPVNKASEIANVLMYQHDLCRTLDEVADYLNEVRELRAVFRAAESSGASITFVNSTVAEYVEEEMQDQPENTFMYADHPLVVYLTKQSKADQAVLTQLSEAASEIISAKVQDLTKFQVPIFVSPDDIKDAGVGFPLITAATTPLPKLVDAESGSGKDKQAIPADWWEVNSYFVLAASLCLGRGSQAFGQVTTPTIGQRKQAAALLGLQRDLEPGLAVVDLFRESWTSFDSKLFPILMTTKWLNFLLAIRSEAKTIQDHLKNSVTGGLSELYAKNTQNAAKVFQGLETDVLDDFRDAVAGHFPSKGSGATAVTSMNVSASLVKPEWGVMIDKKQKTFGPVRFMWPFAKQLGVDVPEPPADEA